MKRGTIVLAQFPFTDLSSTKRRPAIIVSRKNSQLNDVIVAFISSVIPDELTETDLLFDTSDKDFKSSGLKRKSIFKLDKLCTININIISGELVELSQKTISEIDKRLKIALDLNK